MAIIPWICRRPYDTVYHNNFSFSRFFLFLRQSCIPAISFTISLFSLLDFFLSLLYYSIVILTGCHAFIFLFLKSRLDAIKDLFRHAEEGLRKDQAGVQDAPETADRGHHCGNVHRIAGRSASQAPRPPGSVLQRCAFWDAGRQHSRVHRFFGL